MRNFPHSYTLALYSNCFQKDLRLLTPRILKLRHSSSVKAELYKQSHNSLLFLFSFLYQGMNSGPGACQSKYSTTVPHPSPDMHTLNDSVWQKENILQQVSYFNMYPLNSVYCVIKISIKNPTHWQSRKKGLSPCCMVIWDMLNLGNRKVNQPLEVCTADVLERPTYSVLFCIPARFVYTGVTSTVSKHCCRDLQANRTEPQGFPSVLRQQVRTLTCLNKKNKIII